MNINNNINMNINNNININNLYFLLFFCLPVTLLLSSNTALHQAAKAGDVNQCQIFLNKGCGVNQEDKKARTPLHYASMRGHQRVCDFLIKQGADINAKDQDGNTLLHCSAAKGNQEACTFLMRKGSNLFQLNKQYKAALDVAKNDEVRKVIILYEKIKIAGYLGRLKGNSHTPAVIIDLVLFFSLGKKR